MVNGYDGYIDSYEKRIDQAYNTIDNLIANYNPTKYTGEIGNERDQDRFRQIYAVEMYGPGAQYKWSEDDNNGLHRWIEDSNGVKVLDFEETDWDDNVARRTLASKLALEITDE
jgi:hypothetical protein